MKKIVAIVGRPNVGKSTLFNKMAGRRIAIVEDTPGVTRDRIHADCEWNSREFTIVDTGGMDIANEDEIYKSMLAQAITAIDTADVIVFVVDGTTPITANDIDIGERLNKCGKTVLLAINKCDSPGTLPESVYDYYELGITPIFISALHGMGTGDLLDEIVFNLGETPTEEPTDSLKIAIVGKPNAGKSSLINKIIGEQRVIVSPIAGTTRDSIDAPFTRDGQEYTLIDTAGMRKRGKIDEDIERYSVMRALSSIDRADVVILIIDATEGVTEQDSKIAGYAHDNGKAILVAVNKWDIVEKETNTQRDYRFEVQEGLNFMLYSPIIFISAKTGLGIQKLFEMANHVANQNAMRISTGMLNDVLGRATTLVQPPSDKGKRLKIYYATQASVKPPTFVVFINNKKLAHFSYIRYIENKLRETFGFEGTAIRFILREKGEKNK